MVEGTALWFGAAGFEVLDVAVVGAECDHGPQAGVGRAVSQVLVTAQRSSSMAPLMKWARATASD